MSHRVDDKFRQELTWEEKAKQNPLYAVMSAEQFADKTGDPSTWTQEDLAMFFAKGQAMYENYLRPVMVGAGMKPDKALMVEYGSGMGRILKAMHNAGYQVGGIDISPTMLEYSRQLVPEVSRLSLLDDQGKSSFEDGSADFVFCYAVLQHIPTISGVQRAVHEMCRLLKPGGLLKLQIRTMESPFIGLRHGGNRVVNFEKQSLIIKTGFINRKRRLGIPPIPAVKVERIDHTFWVGVPIAYRTLQKFLRQNGVQLIGIEQFVTDKRNMAWILGRKEG